MQQAGERLNYETHKTIFWLPIAAAAEKSRGVGKSPKLVSSDHCHISAEKLIAASIKEVPKQRIKKTPRHTYLYLEPRSHPT